MRILSRVHPSAQFTLKSSVNTENEIATVTFEDGWNRAEARIAGV